MLPWEIGLPTTSSIGMIVRPKTRSVSSHGSLTSKGKREGDKAVPTSSLPIIGESAGMFTDMTEYNVESIR